MDHYQTLGVRSNASPEQIKSAYRKLVREYHPDTHDGDPQRTARFQQIQAAYEVFSDEARRRAHDVERRAWIAHEGAVECPTCGAVNRVTKGSRGAGGILRCGRCKGTLPGHAPAKSQSDHLAQEFLGLWDEFGGELSSLAADGIRSGFDYLRHRYRIARRGVAEPAQRVSGAEPAPPKK